MKVNKKNQGGFIVTIELLVIATVLVLGLIVGWTSLRDSVLSELSDLSESVGALNQGYQISSVVNTASTASTAGSAWTDAPDTANGKGIDVDTTLALSGDASSEYTYGQPATTVEDHTNLPTTIN